MRLKYVLVNPNTSTEKKNTRTTLIKWELVAIVVVMVLILAAASIPGWNSVSQPAQLVVYGSLLVLGGFILYITLFRWRTLETRLTDTQAVLDRTRNRLGLVIRLGQELALVEAEDDAIAVALDTCMAVAETIGISYLPFDERGHARPMVAGGEVEPEGLKSLADYLALPSVRATCALCNAANPGLHLDCALPLPKVDGVDQILCVPIRRYGRDIGLINIYLGEGELLDTEAEAFLTATFDELAIVVESIRLRNKNNIINFQGKPTRQIDFSFAVPQIAENYFRLSGADFLVLSTEFSPENEPVITHSFGRVPLEFEGWILDTLRNLGLERPAYTGNSPPGGENYGINSPRIISGTLNSQSGTVAGGIVMGWGIYDNRPSWSPTRVQEAADGLSMVVEIANSLREMEFKTIMMERNRLAREIHDGLAQSIGYLKLLSARMNGYLEAGDLTRLADVLADSRAALDEAYEDARSAIDNLIVSPEIGFIGWIERIALEFQEMSRIQTVISGTPLENEPAAEIQAQLIRILQEALTNIRKHAAADQVWIEWYEKHGEITLEIKDDGRGFHPDLLLDSSQHGLLSMRERADLIGADIQLVSSASEGTIVRLRLPEIILQSES